MLKRSIIIFGIFLLVVAGLAYAKVAQIKKGMEMQKMFQPPPTAVTTIAVTPSKWQPTVKAVGSLRAVQGVEVSGDLAGIVREILFESGASVKKGEVLVRLDTRQEEAQLKAALANLDLASAQLARQKELLAHKATSQSEYDTAQANADKAAASVEEIRALIERKVIKAPFDGVLGIRKVNIGQYLEAGKAIVSLESQDPIYVDFSVSQEELRQIAIGKKVHVRVSGYGDEVFEGEVTAINSKFDENTRNILVQATVSNKEGKLRAAMFANVDVLLPEQEGVLAVPASAIIYAPYGDSVYVVKNDPQSGAKVVEQRFVRLGPSRGDQVLIQRGVSAGEEVVTSGGFMLRPNAPVQVDNSIQLGNDPNPTPKES